MKKYTVIVRYVDASDPLGNVYECHITARNPNAASRSAIVGIIVDAGMADAETDPDTLDALAMDYRPFAVYEGFHDNLLNQ